jgi:hypothetical protein
MPLLYWAQIIPVFPKIPDEPAKIRNHHCVGSNVSKHEKKLDVLVPCKILPT